MATTIPSPLEGILNQLVDDDSNAGGGDDRKLSEISP